MRDKIASISKINKKNIPNSFQVIGDIVLLKPKTKSLKINKKIAHAILKLFPRIKTVCEIVQVRGELRKPKVKKLAGDGFETIHKEHGILYKLDVRKIMFSKGNLSERKRLITQIKNNEIIVDMFAGIGYFSLGIAKFSNAKNIQIYAIDKNPIAFRYLKENIKLNKIKNITPLLGDCRTISKRLVENNIKADRIIMGYLPGTEKFLPYALKLAKSGCIIHFHNTYNKSELWSKPIKDIEYACEKADCAFSIINTKIVKSYAPNIYHVVVDFEVM